MNPFWTESLRRHWPVFGALSILLVFVVVHTLFFRATANRYDAALKQAGEMGFALDPSQTPQNIPPRVFALIADNAQPIAAVHEGASSGALAAGLLEDLNRMCGKRGMGVIVTEPGPITQLPNSVELRAHLRVRCHYRDFVGLLDDLAKGGSLIAVERFSLLPGEAGSALLELWVSRCILKQVAATP